jgi:hypothetical protein
MKKKLTLNQLEVRSFITHSNLKRVLGGATAEVGCTAYPICADTTSCATRAGEACTEWDCDDSIGCYSNGGPGCSGTIPCMN